MVSSALASSSPGGLLGFGIEPQDAAGAVGDLAEVYDAAALVGDRGVGVGRVAGAGGVEEVPDVLLDSGTAPHARAFFLFGAEVGLEVSAA